MTTTTTTVTTITTTVIITTTNAEDNYLVICLDFVLFLEFSVFVIKSFGLDGKSLYIAYITHIMQDSIQNV